jgi:hypothetical protein
MGGRCILLLLLLLLLLEKVHYKVLIITDEIVREALGSQVVSKMLPPLGVEGFQGSKLGRWLVPIRAVADAPRRRPRVMRICIRRRRRKIGAW